MVKMISIHAPLAGCDAAKLSKYWKYFDFNPRTPCGVRRDCGPLDSDPEEFQSTHPLRGATKFRQIHSIHNTFQSTHPLRGATQTIQTASDQRRFQSTHPLRGATRESDSHDNSNIFQSTHPLRGATKKSRRPALKFLFQSTHPLRGATSRRVQFTIVGKISIHAPLAGCDRSVGALACPPIYFNPRTPCGVRRIGLTGLFTCILFQSTHPLRGATPDGLVFYLPNTFQSTHPLRGATRIGGKREVTDEISIHAPLAGCDTSN